MTVQKNSWIKQLAATALCLALVVVFALARPTTAHAQSSCGDAVTVADGDTLAQIAIRCGISIPQLLAANPDIEDPTSLTAGQIIVLPNREQTEGAEASETQPSAPTIEIEPANGPPNTVLDITASGFAAESPVTVGLGPPESETIVDVAATTDASGNLSTQLEVPDDARADQRLVVVVYTSGTGGGTEGTRATSKEFVVTDETQAPTATLSRTQGPVGAFTGLRAEGFEARLPVEVGFGPVNGEYDIIAQARTNGRGIFSRRFQMPSRAVPGQAYVFVIIPSDTQAEVVSDAFTVTGSVPEIEPQVSIAPSAVPAGANVQISATGFPANTRVSYGVGEPESETFDLFSARTSANGSLQTTVRVPEEIAAGTELVALVYVPQRRDARATSDVFTVTQQDEGEGILFTSTNIYLIALENAGRDGQEIGCGDSVIPVEVEIEPTIAPLTAALETLFSIDERFYGESGLYNALYRADIAVERIDIVDDVASIYLTGDFAIGGICDNPRVRAQLEETALQYYTVDEVQIFINGESLDSLLSGRG